MSDLSARDPRKLLSKSFMNSSCGEKAWLDIYHPLPWTPNEAVIFGSAVDAGCSLIIASLRSGQAPDMDAALAAAASEMERAPDIEVDGEGVKRAIESFVALPYDWSYARIGMRAGGAEAFAMRLELPGVGLVDAHPDIVLRDHSVWDIKTGANRRPEDSAANAYTELGFYGICYEAMTGEVVPEVGYLHYARRVGVWQQLSAPFTDEYRARAYAVARRWAAAIAASGPDINATFTFGPKYGCAGCQYHPSVGGPCEVALSIREAA